MYRIQNSATIATVTDLRRSTSAVMERAAQGDVVVVQKDNEPQGVYLSYASYCQLLERLDRVQAAPGPAAPSGTGGDAVALPRELILPALERNGVVRAAVFGSAARGEAGPDSDLDLLVEFEAGRTLFDLVELRDELTRLLGRRADVVTYAGLHPRLRERVLREQVPIL
jgi:uncharacterized protein